MRHKLQRAALRLTDAARQFYNGCLELHSPGVIWQKFKDAFRQRFRDTHTDQYHFVRLQTARQGRNESPQEFADRCRELSQKIVCKLDDPVVQRIHNENEDRMLLASFVAGLTGVPGTQVRYQNPPTLVEALKVALAVQEAEKQEKFGESFYASFNNSVRLRSSSPTHHARHAEIRTQGQRNKCTRSDQRPRTPGSRNAQAKAAFTCYECEGVGHFSRECPTRLRKEANSMNSSGKMNLSERSRSSHAPVVKPAPAAETGVSKRNTNQGNAREV